MDSNGPALKKQKTEIYQQSAKEAFTFRYVSKQDLLESPQAHLLENVKPFKVQYVGQIFGQDDSILGFTDLKIDVWVCLDSFHVFIETTFSSKSDHPSCTDLHSAFANAFPTGYCTEWSNFVAQCTSEPDVYFAKSAFKGTQPSTKSGEIRLYQYNRLRAPEDVQRFHERMESLTLFYIEGASFIDQDDENWELFFATQVQRDETVKVLGFASVYKYYVAPDGCRLEVGHVMVPPVFQGMGVGSALLRRVYQFSKEIGAIDVTVETPISYGMQILRERVDLQRCSEVEWMQEAVAKTFAGSENGADNGLNKITNLTLLKSIRQRMQQELQISREQAPKVWECLLWKQIRQKERPDLQISFKQILRKRIGGVEDKRKQAMKCVLDRGVMIFEGQKIRTFVMMKCDNIFPSGARGVSNKQEQEAAQHLMSQVNSLVEKRLKQLDRIIGFAGEPKEEM
eukprot:TRINITY_DN2074_c0_g1_i4.p2 TRINITY_DN2074_c0_g1~~TRINITY_DN2074_c0_g1_i4.p2  ORF type:complete len:493 (+),score=49.74 TRINITY_DN2074_c0_g1_i4:117-1481(+)